MAQIIDRREDGKHKSAVNRRLFIQRYRRQIKEAVAEAMERRSITDMEHGERVTIPARDLAEPTFQHGRGGRRTSVHPGNKEFLSGDRLPRPQGASGGEGGASDGGTGEDTFVFQLSRDEFLDVFFEDLALPNLVRTELASIPDYRNVRAGHTRDGVPCNINVIRSLRGSLARRIALGAPHNERLRAAEEALARLPPERDEADPEVQALRAEIDEIEARLRAIPFLDAFDLRYNHRTRRPEPTSRAVMFCLMDVSGSMNQERKDLAKRFFTLLYLFLRRGYEHTEVVFIRHHTVAKEVGEEEFFYSRETGGTVVSSALKLMLEIIGQRYAQGAWNIYGAQASDGDNWRHDSPACRELLLQRLMPRCRHFAYVEITPYLHQSLWEEYLVVQEACPTFAMRQIDCPGDIFPVFRDLFRRRAQ